MIQAHVYYNYHYRLFEGILVITNILCNNISEIIPSKPILHVPMLVDFDRFDRKVRKNKVNYL